MCLQQQAWTQCPGLLYDTSPMLLYVQCGVRCLVFDTWYYALFNMHHAIPALFSYVLFAEFRRLLIACTPITTAINS